MTKSKFSWLKFGYGLNLTSKIIIIENSKENALLKQTNDFYNLIKNNKY